MVFKRKIFWPIIACLIIILMTNFSYALLDFTETKRLLASDIWMRYKTSDTIVLENITLNNDYQDYIEFIIEGNNKDNAINYDLVLNQGKVLNNKNEDNRIPAKYLKFKLVQVNDLEEIEIFTNQTYSSLINRKIYLDKVLKTTNYSKTYRLYVKIDESLVIDNLKAAFASINLSVKVNLDNTPVESNNLVSIIKEKYGIDNSLAAINSDGALTNDISKIREYRFSGENVNNYVVFNDDLDDLVESNELWRIIGIFKSENNQEYIKLVRNQVLTKEELPMFYKLDNTIYNLKRSKNDLNVYWYNQENKSSSNDFTRSGINYYLNSLSDETNKLKTGYLSLFKKSSKDLLVKFKYDLGNVEINSLARDFYNKERDIKICNNTVVSNDNINNCNVWYGNQTSWQGLIGLLYPSDILYSMSSLYWSTELNSDTLKTSWLMNANHNNSEWLISPSSNSKNDVAVWNLNGLIEFYDSKQVNAIRPVIYLPTDIQVQDKDATGSLTSPYKIVE